MLPRITLITPSYQQAAFLDECMRSVHDQDYPDLEHMVVDGGSTDGSVPIIESYAARLAWWCSERDRGQSHALNKGIERATGAVFGWINSDDLLLPGALLKVGQAFASDPGLVVLTGVRLKRLMDGSEYRMGVDDPADPDKLFTAPHVNQQCTFYRMDAVREAGLIEERLHCVMDYELWLQVLFRKGTAGLRIVPWELAVFRAQAESKSIVQKKAFLDEQAAILARMCSDMGLDNLACVLAIGHDLPGGIRGVPLRPKHRALVRSMAVAFLLKWHFMIFSQRDFSMMQRFRKLGIGLGPLDDEQRSQLRILDEQLRSDSWLMFRIRRKWDHLFG
ncbi:MAG: glycosyltransferase [Flavobacteriales bacterium]|jgi:glycosyltransferase involved in cell wall biosynthesis|nr:glycosyltransferase [Flavobacteriales bacterium]